MTGPAWTLNSSCCDSWKTTNCDADREGQSLKNTGGNSRNDPITRAKKGPLMVKKNEGGKGAKLTPKRRTAGEQTQRDKRPGVSGTEKTAVASLAKDINEAHATVLASHKKTLTAAMEAGRHLTDAKKLVGHGKWLAWLKENCPQISERTARNYLTLHLNRSQIEGIKSANVADFNLCDAYRVIAELSRDAKVKEDAEETPTPEPVVKWDSPACQLFGEWLAVEYPEADSQKSILREIRNWIDAKLKEAA